MADQLNERLGSLTLAKDNPNLGSKPTFKDGATTLDASSPFWDTATIDETRWDQSFPFQFIIVKSTGQGQYTQLANSTFTLPIPPEALQKSMPFAISKEHTLGGVVENHNGIKHKLYTLSGTMGVLPGRAAGKSVPSFNVAQSIFAGTVRSAQQVGASFTATFGNPPRSNSVTDQDITGDLKGTTGYYQFQLLEKYLEAYANMKEKAGGKKYQLAFCHWKTQEVLLITPLNFDVRQAWPEALEYRYTIQFDAWRRINLQASGSIASNYSPAIRNPGAMGNLVQSLDNMRHTLSGLNDVITSAGQDVDNVLFEPLRSVSLMAKDLLGIPITLADLPVNMIRDLKSAILEYVGIGMAASDTSATLGSFQKNVGAEFQDIINQLQYYTTHVGKGDTQNGQSPDVNVILVGPAGPDPGNKILENPRLFYDFFAKLKPGDLNVPPAVTRKIVLERERVRNLKRLDYQTYRDNIIQLMNDFSDLVGAGSSSYNKIYGRSPAPSTKTPTQDDFDAIFALNQSAIEMNRLAVSGEIGDQHSLTAIEYVAGLASRSGITFTVPNSKFQVPFPYGCTLEKLADRYLGDSNRWLEIAALNKLREPYVDEEGFDLPLLVNGNGNQIVIADSSNLFIGQTVWITSRTQVRQKRHITVIDVIADNNVLITVDGDPTLDVFKLTNAAELHAFLPDTVNSQMLISIPDPDASTDPDFQLKSIPGLDEFQQLIEVGGVDLLLTPSGDAAITHDGDWKLAVGLTNLIQRVRVFFGTPKGSLIHHKSFGYQAQAGRSTADFTAQDLLSSTKDLFDFEPAFTGVKYASVLKSGPSASLSIGVEVTGSRRLIPITIQANPS